MTFKLPESMGFMWQHNETGRCGFSESNQREMWAKGNPRLHIIDNIYTHTQLIQALKDWSKEMAKVCEVESEIQWAIGRDGSGSEAASNCTKEIRNKAKELI